MTQIVKAAFRLLSLQRRRDKGQSQGQQRENKEERHPSKSKVANMANCKDPEGPGGKTVAEEDQGSRQKGADNNSPIETMTSKKLSSCEEGEWALERGHHNHSLDHGETTSRQRQAETERESEIDPSPADEGGLNLDGGIKRTLSGKRKRRKGTGNRSRPKPERKIEIPPAEDREKVPLCEAGQGFEKGSKRTPAEKRGGGKIGPLKHCCYFCQKTFPTPSALERHLTTHTQEKPFVCNFCGKEFAEKGTLENHIRSHLKEKAYKCNVCGKDFVTKGALDRHIRRHLKEKWFKCSHEGCTSSFTTAGELKIHSRVHSGEKPFACPHPGCGRVFGQSGNLRIHSRIHSGERPFVCPFPGCGKTFNQQGTMTRHRKTHDRSSALEGQGPLPLIKPTIKDNVGKKL